MRCVVQRCLSAICVVEGETIGEIGNGLVVFVGFKKDEELDSLDYILDKIFGLRVFEDEDEKMNLSLTDLEKDLLIIPNFTLYGDVRKGRRPSFIQSEGPDRANDLFNTFVDLAKKKVNGKIKVATGKFQSDMKINVLNDGPVTILLDSERGF